ncbi:MAG: hypothetical protein Kow00120_08220 [Anaerolineae bacterium]
MWGYLPRSTAVALRAQLNQCQNLGLILDRFNPWMQEPNGMWQLRFRIEELRQREWKPRTAREGEAKGLWLGKGGDSRTRLIDEPVLKYPRINLQLLKAHRVRWEAMVGTHGAIRFDLLTESRLVVGLGADSVLETSLTLHRVYGYPIIPGSALKGLARTLALLELAAELGVPALTLAEYWERKSPDRDSAKPTPLNKLDALLEADLDPKDAQARQRLAGQLAALKNDPALPQDASVKELSLQTFAEDKGVQEFHSVFGSLKHAGSVIFFDAIPAEPPKLAADVMNPHFPDYYRGGERFPDDAGNPNPVAFLVVEPGVQFSFAVAARRGQVSVVIEPAQKASEWLKRALREVGIGAKTGAGYGVFGKRRPLRARRAAPEPEPPPPTRDPQPRSKPGDDIPEVRDEVSDDAEAFMRFLQSKEDE